MKFIIYCLFFLSFLANAKQVRLAVIDTGIDLNNTDAPICGLYDLTGEGIYDFNGHGTHVSDTIDQYVKNRVRTRQHPNLRNKPLNKRTNYCQYIIKFYTSKGDALLNTVRTIQAFNLALKLNVDIINYSAGGPIFVKPEKDIIKKLLDNNITLVTVAGNDGVNIDEKGYYPASYDSRVIVVGNLKKDGTKNLTSNFGNTVRFWEVGTEVLALLPGKVIGTLTGTSQATAVKTGKIINKVLELP